MLGDMIETRFLLFTSFLLTTTFFLYFKISKNKSSNSKNSRKDLNNNDTYYSTRVDYIKKLNDEFNREKEDKIQNVVDVNHADYVKKQIDLLSLNYNNNSESQLEIESIEKVRRERHNKIAQLLKHIKTKLNNFPAILSREFKLTNTYEEIDSSRMFRIMQFNGLAKNLINSEKLQNLDNDMAFDWNNFRMWRLLEELVRYNCDILCLQEADFYEDIKSYLETIGYSSVFCPKYNSSKFINSEKQDGCCIFYHKKVFRITQLRCQNITLNGEHHSQLKHVYTKKRLTVVCVHLKANEGFAELRKQQTEYVLSILKEHMNEKELIEQCLCICGDFNGERIEEFYDLIVDDKQLKLRDSYDRKISINNLKRAKYVDYIFYSNQTLRLLSHLKEDRRSFCFNLPSLRYPSDHLSLICDFQFVYTNK